MRGRGDFSGRGDGRGGGFGGRGMLIAVLEFI